MPLFFVSNHTLHTDLKINALEILPKSYTNDFAPN